MRWSKILKKLGLSVGVVIITVLFHMIYTKKNTTHFVKLILPSYFYLFNRLALSIITIQIVCLYVYIYCYVYK